MISPNTAKASAEAIRRGHQGGMDTPGWPGHDDDDACLELARRLDDEAAVQLGESQPPAVGAEVSFAADESATPEAGPGGTPKITIRLTTEISGEWVTNLQIAYAAQQLAGAMAARLREAANEARKEQM